MKSCLTDWKVSKYSGTNVIQTKQLGYTNKCWVIMQMTSYYARFLIKMTCSTNCCRDKTIQAMN